MTAINCFVRDDGVHFVADGMTYMPGQGVVGRLAKIYHLPWLGGAFAATGFAMCYPLIASKIGDTPLATFDELVAEFAGLMSSAVSELRRGGNPLLDNCEVVIAGWSDATEEYRAFALATFSHNGQPPFTLRPVTTYMRPYPPALISAMFDPDHAARDGMAILSVQRNAPSEGLNGQREVGAVGAFGQHGHLTRDGLMLRCIGTWPEDAAVLAAKAAA